MKASSSPALVAMASRSDLSTRVTALLDATQRRGRVGRRAAILVLPGRRRRGPGDRAAARGRVVPESR